MNLLQQLFGFDEGMFYKEFVNRLETEVLDDNQTLLDIGCGTNSPIQHFNDRLEYTVGIDLFPKAIEASRERGLHNEYHQMDVLEIKDRFGGKSFDCVLAADLIEHLTPKDGEQLLDLMEQVARKKIIIYTPNGFVPQHEYEGNEFQKHLSGWSAEDMISCGYQVTGMVGPKFLRGEQALVKWRPRLFWGKVSALLQPYVRNHPNLAFQIFCVKTLP